MVRWLRYFAYGSNMHPARLRERTPSCRRIGVASLPGYALRFNQASRVDGSAKCNIMATGATAEDRVLGVVFELPVAERSSLDRAEGLGHSYQLRELAVRLDGREEGVFCYTALPEAIDDRLLPFRWYREIVLHGARQHDFPTSYLSRISSVAVIDDPDPRRDARHRALLEIDEPLRPAIRCRKDSRGV